MKIEDGMIVEARKSVESPVVIGHVVDAANSPPEPPGHRWINGLSDAKDEGIYPERYMKPATRLLPVVDGRIQFPKP